MKETPGLTLRLMWHSSAPGAVSRTYVARQILVREEREWRSRDRRQRAGTIVAKATLARSAILIVSDGAVISHLARTLMDARLHDERDSSA